MAAHDSDEEEDFVTYGKPLELYEEGEQPKKPVPLHDQTVKDEKGRYKRFHGAFTGGFSAGYFNTVGTKEGWTPSTFVSSHHGRLDKHVSRPEDFMDDEDLSEFGIAPKEIMTTDNFASKTKDRIREKARELASVTAPIPGATILEDLVAAAKITMGVQLLRQMGWKEGQGVGPRIKRRAKKQKPGGNVKLYGCALPPTGSEESDDEEDDFIPENITFAPKDVAPVDFTVKDNVHGLGYRGLNPHEALFGSLGTHINLFSDTSEKSRNLLGDVRNRRGRKVGISGQAFGVGALEDEDDDIYSVDPMSKYDMVLREEETGDGLFGWTAPKEYKNKKGSLKELQYVGKMLEGFCLATQSPPSKKVYPPPDLPRDYRPVHYFRPVLADNSQNSTVLQAMIASSMTPSIALVKEQPASRHQLNSSQRREMLGEAPLQGPTSVLELLSEKDRERIRDAKQDLEEQRSKAYKLAQEAMKTRFQSSSVEEKDLNLQESLLDRQLVPVHPEEFRPFERNSEKQKRYESYIRNLHKGQKDALESCLDANMTEWERSREREEFMRSAMLYKPTNSQLSSRFTRGKHEDDSDKVEVPRDQEGDLNDKVAAVKMKMFGKLTRDKHEWHPDRLLCKRFNIPDPYPGSTIIGLPKVKRDKYSVFNFLVVPETKPTTNTASSIPEKIQQTSEIKARKASRWDMSASEEKKKDPISDFLSLARSKSEVIKEETNTKPIEPQSTSAAVVSSQGPSEHAEPDSEEEEKRPPIDLFKAIFAESSDEKSSSSDEDSDEDLSPAPNTEAETSKSEAATSSSIQDPESSIKLLAHPTVHAAKEELKIIDEEEFGPKLPPASISSGPPMSSTYSSGNVNEPTKKQKHKKHKEKHKNLKKESKHKKEKKKKHKKQKHKSKQRSRKTDDKSTDDSSESPNDSENTGDITPKELLKRLKNLPIPHSQR